MVFQEGPVPDPIFDRDEQIAEQLRSLKEDVDFLLSLATPRGQYEIDDQILISAANFDFLNISQDFRHLVLRFSLKSDRTSSDVDECLLKFNNDSSSIYDSVRTSWLHSAGYVTNEKVAFSSLLITEVAADVALAASFAVGKIEVPDYTVTTKNKTSHAYGGYHKTEGAGGNILTGGTGTWKSTAAISRITIFPEVGSNWLAGSRMTLFGVG